MSAPQPSVGPDEASRVAATPYRLLWSTAIVAAMLAAVAFLLWGTVGASALFDMIVALCM